MKSIVAYAEMDTRQRSRTKVASWHGDMGARAKTSQLEGGSIPSLARNYAPSDRRSLRPDA